MAGQTPRNWQIDLLRAPIQAVASRASAMSIILEKARIREIVSGAFFLSFDLVAIGPRDRRRLIAPKIVVAASDGVACRRSGSTSNAASVAPCPQRKLVISSPLGTY